MMMPSIAKAIIPFLLSLTATDRVDANSHCGLNYNDAVSNCNRPCSFVGIDEENCEPGMYCFGPGLPCDPPTATADGKMADAALPPRPTPAAIQYVLLSDMAAYDSDSSTTASPVASPASSTASPTIVNSTSSSSPTITNSTTSPPTVANSTTSSPTTVNATTSSPPTIVNDTSSSPTIMNASDDSSSSPPTVINTTTASPTTMEDYASKLADERRGMDNPANHYCGTSWDHVMTECNNNPNAVPCPRNLPCPSGQMCFAVGLMCTPVTFSPTLVPSYGPTTYHPTTLSPSSSPIGANDVSNRFFCGTSEEEANSKCGRWCRYGTDDECPENQKCHLTTSCNATAMNYTSAPTSSSPTSPAPTLPPMTLSPTEDLNPGNFYCASEWRDSSYEGECGVPCPSGLMTDCPSGMYCYGDMINCIKTHKVNVSTSWCGSTFDDMSQKCANDCPGGNDDECPDSETCFAESPCALLDSKRLADEEARSKRWCGRSYKHLVEHCSQPCPSGSDDECGSDEEGNDMICFDMSDEEQSCNETGVGIKDPVDPDNLWCGTSWNHVLENCPKKCPEGTDEECDAGSTCYDLTGNDPMICKTEGYGVKKKGDPNMRYCGDTYNHMMEFCPKRCPNGDECPGSMTCFEESPCEMEGQTAPGFVKQDTSKMYCGAEYADAMQCTAACPGGSDAECPPGTKCWGDVECAWDAKPQSQTAMAAMIEEAEDTDEAVETEETEEAVDDSNNMIVDVSIEVEGDQEGDANEAEAAAKENEPMAEVEAEQESQPEAQLEQEPEAETQPQPNPPPPPPVESKPDPSPSAEAKPEPEPAPLALNEPNPKETESKPSPPAPQPESEPKPAPPATESKPSPPASDPKPSPPATENSPPAPESKPSPSAAESLPADSSPAESSSTETSIQSNPFGEANDNSAADSSTVVAVDNLRMALFGLTELSASQLVAWEDLTARYVEEYYSNNPVGISDVAADFEVTSLNLASGRRRKNLRRVLQDDVSAFLLTYKQTIQYQADEDDINIGELLALPFQTEAARADYLAYLKEEDPMSFENLVSVSAVFLPDPLEVKVVSEPAATLSDAADTMSTSSGGGGSSSLNTAGNPFGEAAASPPSSGGGEVYSDDFYCHNSGEACPSGECRDKDLCMFVPPAGSTVEIAPFSGNSAPSPDTAASFVSSVLGGTYVSNNDPTPSSPTPAANADQQAAPNTPQLSVVASEANDTPQPLISASYGPADVPAIQMTLRGLSLRAAKEIFEWQYLTAIYEQQFYNDMPLTQDYVQNSVYAFATALEVTEIIYGEESVVPSTTLTFKQTVKYTSIDSNISMMDVVTQPFATQEYRVGYAKFLRDALKDSFGALEGVLPVGQGRAEPAIALVDTLFCSRRWPVDCHSAQPCENDSDCPDDQDCLVESRCAEMVTGDSSQQQQDVIVQQSVPAPGHQLIPVPQPTAPAQTSPTTSTGGAMPYHSACNICRPDQVGVNSQINFNGRLTDCREAYDFMAKNYDEGDANCVGAQEALSGSCCKDVIVAEAGTPPQPAPVSSGGQSAAQSQPTKIQQSGDPYLLPSPAIVSQPTAVANSSPSSPTKITVMVSLKEDQSLAESTGAAKPKLPYLSDTYYCGTSFEDAATFCSIPCPSSSDDECPGNLQCFGNTECMNRESFFCGSSWLDASDKCSNPCPSGDALECDAGEACFAWTSCKNTDSFYCGVSFEDASTNCALPCPTRSSLDCPEGQGCFAYTTCESPNDPPHKVDPLNVPMNDYFCGESKELASSTCSIACQSGEDSECPGDMKCFDGTGCSSRDSFWCGPTWKDAAQQCSKPCSSGSSDECPAGESCYAHTGCQANLFFCGDTFEDAGETCSKPCPNRSSEECSGGQWCFAFVTECLSEEDGGTSQPNSQSYSFNVANTQWELDAAEGAANNKGVAEENIDYGGNPSWYTKWENEAANSSSISMGSISLILVVAAVTYVSLADVM